jgi:hypothetical protein
MRWKPFREIDTMQRQMNWLFAQMTSYGMSPNALSNAHGVHPEMPV